MLTHSLLLPIYSPILHPAFLPIYFSIFLTIYSPNFFLVLLPTFFIHKLSHFLLRSSLLSFFLPVIFKFFLQFLTFMFLSLEQYLLFLFFFLFLIFLPLSVSVCLVVRPFTCHISMALFLSSFTSIFLLFLQAMRIMDRPMKNHSSPSVNSLKPKFYFPISIRFHSSFLTKRVFFHQFNINFVIEQR